LFWFREKFPDEAIFKKSADEIVYEQLTPFLKESKVPDDNISYPADVIRINLGHQVERESLLSQ